MSKLKTITLLAFLFIGIANSYGKTVKVELSTGELVNVYSKISLYQDSTLVASQSFRELKFNLPDVVFNKLKLEAPNYKDVVVDYNQKDTLLCIDMCRDTTVQLKEVVVAASTVMQTEGLNTKFINVADGYLGTFHSGMETLEWTPGLAKINGSILVPGRGEPLIYIDNRRLSSQKELASILSSDISSIEIIREPGGEFPPGTTSVIRIKMKKRLHDFVSLTPNVRYTQRSHNAGCGVSLSSNFRVNKLSGTMSFEYSHGGSNPECTSTTVITDAVSLLPVEECNTVVKSRYRNNDVSVFGGASYELNSDSRLQVQYSGNFDKGNTNSETRIGTLLPESQIKSYQEKQHSRNHSHNAGIGYYLEKNNTTLSVRASYNDIQRNLSNDIFQNTQALASSITNPISYKAWLSYAELVQNIGKGVLTAGYTWTHSSNSNNYIIDAMEQPVTVKSNVFSGYASYAYRIKKVTLRGGLAYTYDYLKCEDADVNPFCKNYNLLNPSTSVDWRIKDKILRLSYKRSGYAPQYYELNPNIEFTDSMNFYVGNLNLDYSKSNNITISFGEWKDLSTSLEYVWCDNSIIDSYTLYEKVPNAILTQPINEGHYKNVRLDLTYSLWNRKYNVYASSLVSYSSNEYPAIDGMAKYRQWSWMLMLNARYTFAGRYNVFTNSWYQTPSRFGNRRMGHTLGVNIGMSATFIKNKLKISLSGNDLFNKAVSPTTLWSYSNNVARFTKNNHDGRCVSISITYTFNKVKTSFERDDSYEGFVNRASER